MQTRNLNQRSRDLSSSNRVDHPRIDETNGRERIEFAYRLIEMASSHGDPTGQHWIFLLLRSWCRSDDKGSRSRVNREREREREKRRDRRGVRRKPLLYTGGRGNRGDKGPRGTSGEDRRNAAGSRIRNMMPPWWKPPRRRGSLAAPSAAPAKRKII